MFVSFTSVALKFIICIALLLASATSANGGDISTCDAPTKTKPNIILIITDDQDLQLNSLAYQPAVQKHFWNEGTFFRKHYCTVALCCPSRVSLLTGRAAHNTNVTDVSPPFGGYPKFISQGLNERYLPVWMQRAGYNTYYTGKLFNSHSVLNYNAPFAAGYNGSDFLLEPSTYDYLNSTWQRNHDAPVSHPGEYSTDVLAEKSFRFLDDAHRAGSPFFFTIAPIAPHAHQNTTRTGDVFFMPPVPAERHKHLFKDVQVPRTESFNPEIPSGVSWVKNLPRQSDDNVAYNDEYYRSRLRALQAVDEFVDGIFSRLTDLNILENTYIFYTSDNGFHIGQHRLQPGKTCSFEEDINVPMFIRGPGVPKNKTSDLVTTHTDLVPTIFNIAGISPHDDFDGKAIPLSENGIARAEKRRHEHVNVEFWGPGAGEGLYGYNINPVMPTGYFLNNTYKAVRIHGRAYSLLYVVWCTGDHEVYDLLADPSQIKNLYNSSNTLLGFPVDKVIARLDALLLVLKSCKAKTCIDPWEVIHPHGDVSDLSDALACKFDAFYENQNKVAFTRCALGQLLDVEGPMNPLVYKNGAMWHEWT